MTRHRILFGLLSPGLGGHTRTAVALARVLRDRGHLVDVLVRDDRTTSSAETDALVHEAGFATVPIAGLYSWAGHGAFRRHLRDIVRRGDYDAIHWFEFYDAVRDAALVARETGRAFVWTVTSGGVPIDYYGLNRVVVFTREVAEDAARRSPGSKVYVLPARIDFRALTLEARARARREIRHAFAVSDKDVLVVRVGRCASVYLHSVRLGIALVSRLNHDGHRATFLHAGFVHQPDVALEIRTLVEQANAEAGRTIAHSVTEGLETGTHYAAAADVCIGSGRTAIEAIALDRPTLVAWGARYLGLVDEANIATMADTNFQGRQSQTIVSDADVVAQMAHAVCGRLASDDATPIQASCAQFVRERYSVESAADVYEQLYADRTVTVAGALAHFSNPQHLGREILRRLPAGLANRGVIARLRQTRASPTS
ncbi:MAG TPA: glycosyltransferase [Vicinamibacterales bacterium]|jgi:hypothetical protein|nr:glycosyltransferase [Vicinamibacterales bacterium]